MIQYFNSIFKKWQLNGTVFFLEWAWNFDIKTIDMETIYREKHGTDQTTNRLGKRIFVICPTVF